MWMAMWEHAFEENPEAMTAVLAVLTFVVLVLGVYFYLMDRFTRRK